MLVEAWCLLNATSSVSCDWKHLSYLQTQSFIHPAKLTCSKDDSTSTEMSGMVLTKLLSGCDWWRQDTLKVNTGNGGLQEGWCMRLRLKAKCSLGFITWYYWIITIISPSVQMNCIPGSCGYDKRVRARACFLFMAGLSSQPMRTICNVFSQWLRSCSVIDRKQALVWYPSDQHKELFPFNTVLCLNFSW